jgi:hypothetical protein
MAHKPDLETAFKTVASWFASYFSSVGPGIGSTFANALHCYSELATSPHKYVGEEWQRRVEELDKESDRLLMEFFLHYLNAKGYRVGNDDDGHVQINVEPSQN